MRTSILLAATAALAAAGAAIAQDRLPENLGNPSRAPENVDSFRSLSNYDFEPYQSGAYNDMIIRQESGGRCWLRYVAVNSDTNAYRYGAAVEMPCSMTIAQAVRTENNTAGTIVTLAELRASVGEGPAAYPQGYAARTGSTSQVSARVPDYAPDYGYDSVAWAPDVWMEHQDACGGRYRTFNPSTDMYFDTPGHKRYCNIGLKPVN